LYTKKEKNVILPKIYGNNDKEKETIKIETP
jgi:hypothetical protein